MNKKLLPAIVYPTCIPFLFVKRTNCSNNIKIGQRCTSLFIKVVCVYDMSCSRSDSIMHNVEIITKIKSNMHAFSENMLMEFLDLFCMYM